MTEMKPTEEARGERFSHLIAVLIAVVTLCIALVTYLQADAGNRDDRANRDTKRYSLEAMGRKISGDARVNYDYNTAYQAYTELDLLARSAEAANDEAGAARYTRMRDQMVELTPLLQAAYQDSSGAPDVARYEADTYLVETTALTERFSAASAVKDAWDSKANTYIVHLTLLAVALFLFGMAASIAGPSTRWIFTGSGAAVALVALTWAAILFAQPVKDLRECKTAEGVYAIDAYAKGVGLETQDKPAEAVQAFDQAITCDAGYSAALVGRARAQAAQDNLKAAATDYESARKAGDASADVAGDLAWIYYLLGRFDDAIAMNQTALLAAPGELWIRYDLGLATLAKGEVDAARAVYAAGMQTAAEAVAQARAAGREPDSTLWWSLEDAAASLDGLIETAGTAEAEPRAAAEGLIKELKSLAVALEYTGKPPAGEVPAVVSAFSFAVPIKNESGETVDYEPPADSFANGTDEVAVLFDYSGMQDGQEVIFKVYVNGEEDPAWRIVDAWALGAEGSAEKPLSLSYSNTAVLQPGGYVVEMYVDAHLVQRGGFVIEE